MNPAFPANYWAYLNTPSDDAYGEVVDASAMTVEGTVAYGEPYYDYLYGQGFDPRLAGNLGGPWGGKSVTPKGYQYSGMPRSAGAQSFLTSTNSQPSSVPHSLPSTLSDGAYEQSLPNSSVPSLTDGLGGSFASSASRVPSDADGADPGRSSPPVVIDAAAMSVAQMIRGEPQLAAATARMAGPAETGLSYAQVAKLPHKPRPGYKENKREQEKPVRIVKTGDPLDIRAKDKERRLVAETTAAEAKGAARRAQKALNPLYGTRN